MAKAPAKSKKAKYRIPLSAVVYNEGGWWFAHCLELDIVAESDSAAGAIKDVLDLAVLQLNTAAEEGDIESVIRPAPVEFWKMFWLASQTKTPYKPKFPVERFEARQLALV